MAETFDRVGQWLIQLPLLAQASVLCVVLLVAGGFVAFVFVGAIDVVSGRLWQRSVCRWKRSQEPRGVGSESQPMRQWPADSSPGDPEN